MSENPLQAIFQTFEKISHCVQSHLSQFIGVAHHPSPTNKHPLFSLSSSSKANLSSSNTDSTLLQPKDDILNKGKYATPVTKEELGRATWTFLHTLAAQYPEKPTRQQKKDVKELMAILSRMYPCKECADHLKEVLSMWDLFRISRSEGIFRYFTTYDEQILYRLDLKLSFPNGYVMCTMLLTEALVSWYFPVSELMHGGAS